MFDRFTDRARKVMGLSRQECQRFHHDYIGPEHILLGLILEGGGVPADVLKNLDVDPRRLRQEVEKQITRGNAMVTMGRIPFTPRAKKVLELSLEEASRLGHNYIGTEHLLLGLICEEKGIAAQALKALNVQLKDVREEIVELLGAGQAGPEDRWEPDPLTRRARRAMDLAMEAALRDRHDHIGTEHILLGLAEEGTGSELANLLLRWLREETEKLLTPGTAPDAKPPLQLTPGARRAMDLAFEAAGHDGAEQVGPGHLLVGLIREKDGIASRVLSAMGIRVEEALAEARNRHRAASTPAVARNFGFDRFADRSRRAMSLARQEAQRLLHDYIGTEHMLLGLVAADGTAVEVLKRLGVDPARVRAETETRLTPGKTMVTMGQLPFTPAMRRVLELALEKATALGTEIREEHLLLGLVAEGRGTAAQVLAALGVTHDAVRKALGPPGPPE